MQKIEEARDVMISAIAQTMVIYGVTPYFEWTMGLANALESGEIFDHYPKHKKTSR